MKQFWPPQSVIATSGTQGAMNLISRSPETVLITNENSIYKAYAEDGTFINSGDVLFDNVVASVKTYIGTGKTPTKSKVVIKFSTGTFTTITGSLADLNRGNIKLWGAGGFMSVILISASAADSVLACGVNSAGTPIPARNDALNIDAANGATTITLNAGLGANYSANDWILLKENTQIDTEIGTTRRKAEIHKIKSVAGDVITLGISDGGGASLGFGGCVYELYSVANTAQLDNLTNPPSGSNFYYENVEVEGLGFSDLAASRAGATLSQGQTTWRFINNLTFTNCVFKDMFHAGAKISQCTNVKFTTCYFEHIQEPTVVGTDHNYYGIECRGATCGITVNGCTFKNMRHGFTQGADGPITSTNCGRTRNITVNGCNFSDTTTAHIDTHQGAVGVTFSNNVCIGDDVSANGIQSRSPCVIKGNTIIGIHGKGISLFCGVVTGKSGSGTDASNSVIMGNYIDGPTSGIDASQGVSALSIIGNNILNVPAAGFCISFTADASARAGDNSVISGNVIIASTSGTILNIDSSNRVSITGNTLINQGGTGTALKIAGTNAAPSHIIFANNVLTGFGGTPINFSSTPATLWIINNDGYNFGGVTPPANGCFGGTTIANVAGAAPADSTIYANRISPKRITFTSNGVGVTALVINGVASPDFAALNGKSYDLQINDTFQIVYGAGTVPTYTWALI